MKSKARQLEILAEKELSRFSVLYAIVNYWELTRFSQKVEGAPRNEDWEAGYQAAMAIARNYVEKEFEAGCK